MVKKNPYFVYRHRVQVCGSGDTDLFYVWTPGSLGSFRP